MQCSNIMTKGIFIQKKNKDNIVKYKPPQLVEVHFKEVEVLEVQLQQSETPAK